jgi:hypothetical protein
LEYKRSGYYYEANEARQEGDEAILTAMRNQEEIPSFYGSLKVYEGA